MHPGRVVKLPSGRSVRVQIGYELDDEGTHRLSIVAILDEASRLALACGHAKCSLQDNFCRRTGRKLALERALRKHKFDKADRAALWAVVLPRKQEATA